MSNPFGVNTTILCLAIRASEDLPNIPSDKVPKSLCTALAFQLFLELNRPGDVLPASTGDVLPDELRKLCNKVWVASQLYKLTGGTSDGASIRLGASIRSKKSTQKTIKNPVNFFDHFFDRDFFEQFFC